MKERLEERLKRLEIGRPDPALRERVLTAVVDELRRHPKPRSWKERLAEWRVELTLAAGIAAAAALLLLPAPLPTGFRIPVPRIDQAKVDQLVEELHLDHSMEASFRTRLDLSQCKLAAMRRKSFEHGTADIEQF